MKLIDAKGKHIACVYRLRFPNGKSYVGQTRDLSDRVKLYKCRCEKDMSGGTSTQVEKAIREFGIGNIEFDVLSEMSMSSRDDLVICLSILEIKYIRDLGTLVPDGYNSSVGGEVLGMPVEFFGALSGVDLPNYKGSKPVLRYNLDGEFEEEYSSIERCAYSLGVDSKDISSFLSSSRRVFRGRHILMYKRYGEIPRRIEPFKAEVIEKKKVVTNVEYVDVVKYREREKVVPNNPILKYNMDGEYCGSYDTLADAAMSIGRNAITKGGIHRGYLFLEHDSGDIRQNIGKIYKSVERAALYSEYLDIKAKMDADREAKKSLNEGSVTRYNVEYEEDDRSHEWSMLINDFNVGQYKLDGELVGVYKGIRGASLETGVPYANIWANVMGRTKKCHGYIWAKCSESGEPIEPLRCKKATKPKKSL